MDGLVKSLFGCTCPYTGKTCEDIELACYKCHIEQEEREWMKEGKENEVLQHEEN